MEVTSVSRPAWLKPFSQAEWDQWQADLKAIETRVGELALAAGSAYGQEPQRRGLRMERDLRGYREYVEDRFFQRRRNFNAS